MSTMQPGDQVSKDPADKRVRTFDWSAYLAVGAELADAGTLTITAVRPVEDPPTLVADNVALIAGNRSVTFRLTGGRRGTLYNVAHKIVSSESPAQEVERSFFVLVEDL